jgi:hypothetical protein
VLYTDGNCDVRNSFQSLFGVTIFGADSGALASIEGCVAVAALTHHRRAPDSVSKYVSKRAIILSPCHPSLFQATLATRWMPTQRPALPLFGRVACCHVGSPHAQVSVNLSTMLVPLAL